MQIQMNNEKVNSNECDKKKVKHQPYYTKGEEIFNYVSHIVGASFGIFSLTFCFIYFRNSLTGAKIASIIIYSISILLLYLMSTLYHALRGTAKRVFRRFDHLTIYILIAGSYTPYCLVALEGQTIGWVIFGIVWGISILGIIFNATMLNNRVVAILSYISYVIIGWIAIVATKQLIASLTVPGFVLLLLGGVAYSVGIIFFSLGTKKKWFHSIWHLWCLAGTLLQFLSIVLYVF